MDSWWQLGEYGDEVGETLALHAITCPFCSERGNFKLLFGAKKKQPNGSKILNFDTYECGNCSAPVMVFWSAGSVGSRGRKSHDFRVLPWPLKLEKYPGHWPEQVGRYWLQANRNLKDENWDAAVVMARSALQVALRNSKASGDSLKKEIEDLARKGILPPIMKDWSDHIRFLGNDVTHPAIDQQAPTPKEARDLIYFLDFLCEYLYTLPKRIENYRSNKK
jgi:hypothetical protein